MLCRTHLSLCMEPLDALSPIGLDGERPVRRPIPLVNSSPRQFGTCLYFAMTKGLPHEAHETLVTRG
jgi:hypothetical protein